MAERRGEAERTGRGRRRREQAPQERLPVTEVLFDRPGAPSPFGDDQTFPLPVSALAYRHPRP